jgi:hypothetical protein
MQGTRFRGTAQVAFATRAPTELVQSLTGRRAVHVGSIENAPDDPSGSEAPR